MSQPDFAQETKAGAFLARLEGAGYRRCEPGVLHPAEFFLNLAGEDIRGALFLTSGAGGAELCLRPEFTIPVARAYLASGQAGSAAAFCYYGPVFRVRSDGPGEFLQGGLESFGRADREAADADILALALEAAERPLKVRMGDAGLFAAFLEKLNLPAVCAAASAAATPAGNRSPPFSPRPATPPATIIPAFWRRLRASTSRARARSSRTCSRSPAFPASAAARSAKSPNAFWSSRR